MRLLRSGIAIGTLILLSCSSPGTYLRSRGADLLDVVPMSVAYGWGLGASVRATPFFELGLAVTPVVSTRLGFDDRIVHGTWYEYQAGLPWSLFVDGGPLPERPDDGLWDGSPPLLYRWQAFRDVPGGEGIRTDVGEPIVRTWGRHPPVVRESMGAFVLPASRGWVEFHDLRRAHDEHALDSLGSPDRATQWETQRELRPAARAWDLVEFDVFFAVVGVRVGLRPVEFLDFVIGFTGLDVLGDDLPVPVNWEPVQLPPEEPAT